MKPTECPQFESCSAPLCPLEKSGTHDIWYPDEEICHTKAVKTPLWVKNQRKIARRTGDKDKYFTYTMLTQHCIIKNGITGIDPDHTEEQCRIDEKRWLQRHPEIREYTAAEKQEFLRRVKGEIK